MEVFEDAWRFLFHPKDDLGLFLWAWACSIAGFFLGTVGTLTVLDHWAVSNPIAQGGIIIAGSLVSSLVVQFLVVAVGEFLDESLPNSLVNAFIFLTGIGSAVGAFFAARAYLDQHSHSLGLVQTGVVGGFAVKIGITILTLVIVPILKSFPALIFGLFAKDWWEKRKARKKPPVAVR